MAQDDELLELMREANMTTVFLGIESPRKASLEETKKTQNVRGDLVEHVLGRFLMAAVVRETPSRRKMALTTLARVLWKRPSAFKESASYLLAYLSLVRFVESLTVRLDQTIESLEKEAKAA